MQPCLTVGGAPDSVQPPDKGTREICKTGRNSPNHNFSLLYRVLALSYYLAAKRRQER